MRIDAHHHFWRYNPEHHVWMTDAMGVLKHDFLPSDLAPLLRSIQFDGSVVVQARQMLEETEWLLDLSDENGFIGGVVGWVDLCSERVGEQLERYTGRKRLKGVRHVVHDESDDAFMAREDFERGIASLAPFGLTYDLLLFPKHLPVARALVEKFPEQPFVLDHISKPDIKAGTTSPWQENLKALAGAGDVHCKLSGMVTEAEWRGWRADDFRRYLDIVVEAFGPERLMIGSDWPVCTLSGEYEPVMRIVIDYAAELGAEAAAAILGDNCARFYGIDANDLEPLSINNNNDG